MSIIETPVIIIGGGGTGLSLSSFLSNYGIEHYLFEKHASTSVLPKAHYLNQRTMETFRAHGLSDAVHEKSAPPRYMSQVGWKTSLGGDGPHDRKLIHKFGCWGGEDGSGTSEVYRRDAATRSANLPLIRLEPVLKEQAEKRNPGKVLFSHALTNFKDEGESVLVTIENQETGKKQQYRCQYLVGADGGKTIGPELGVKLEGLQGIADMVSLHFTADLSEYWDERFFLCYFMNGQSATVLESGVLVPMGPTWGKKNEEWVFHFGFDLSDESRFDEAKLVPRLKKLLKLPDLEVDIHKVSHWVLQRVLADKYKVGRIFLAGDSVHRGPPTTGLVLNTGIEDALNIAWKLKLVLKNKASPQILDTYETERRLVGAVNIDWGVMTFRNSAVINAAIGLIPGKDEQNHAQFDLLFEDSDRGRRFRAQVSMIAESQKCEFCAHGIELGFRYERGLLTEDGTEPIVTDPLGQNYTPTTKPGNRLPHAWIESNGKTISTHDLVVPGKYDFSVITDGDGDDWIKVAEAAAKKHNVAINVAKIGNGCQYTDSDDRWVQINELKAGGALLVRPDNVIAWRSLKKGDPKELEKAIDGVLNFRNILT